MIVVWGSTADSPTARVVDALHARAAPVLLLEPERLHESRVDVTFSPDARGWIESDGRRLDVAAVNALFVRPLAPPADTAAARAAADALLGLATTLAGAVVNRPAPSRANQSKPYQLQLIAAAGLDVADTLVTNDLAAAEAFLAEHGAVVYKSVSGVRSIVNRLDASNLARLRRETFGPIQLQALIPGVDVRVHVVGARLFACEARTAAVDYRYATQQGASVELASLELPPALGARLVHMVRTMELRVAGVDLRRTPDDRWVCLEVNPSPGFSWYEDATGHPIAAAIAEELATAAPCVAPGARKGHEGARHT